MDDFENVLSDLEIAVEGVNATLAKDFAGAAKASVDAIHAAKKAKKAGDYQEAIAKCDEGIAYINNFKARAMELTADGAGAKMGAVLAAAARIIGAILAIAVGSAAIRGAKGANAKRKGLVQGPATLDDLQKQAKKENRKRTREAKTPTAIKNAAGKVSGVVDTAKGKATGVKDVVKDKAGAVADRVPGAVKDKAGAAADYVKSNPKKVATGVATAAVMGKFVKDVKTGSNPTVDNMMKVLDVAVKTLETIKAECQELMRGRDARESVLFAIGDFYDGIMEAVFEYDDMSCLECLVEFGMDDLEACETYASDIVPYVQVIESLIEFEEDDEDEDHELIY